MLFHITAVILNTNLNWKKGKSFKTFQLNMHYIYSLGIKWQRHFWVNMFSLIWTYEGETNMGNEKHVLPGGTTWGHPDSNTMWMPGGKHSGWVPDWGDIETPTQCECLEEGTVVGFQTEGGIFTALRWCTRIANYYIYCQRMYHENAIEFLSISYRAKEQTKNRNICFYMCSRTTWWVSVFIWTHSRYN